MVLYSSLMALLLAFFVTLLTMGQEKTAKFKEGVGEIRDAFGLRGGFGILNYWKSISQWLASDYPEVSQEEKAEASLVGYLKGVLWREGLNESFILKIEYDELGESVMMSTPISFTEDNAFLSRDARWFLNRMGAVFYNLPDCSVTVSCLVNTENPTNAVENELLAVERAVAVTRYLTEKVKIPASRLLPVGFAYDRYLVPQEAEEAVYFMIRRKNNSQGET
jgi:flagellar motor protein MotB